MKKKLMDLMAPWAGHRLVCLSKGPIEDYPSCMLSEGEKEEIAEDLNAEEYEDDDNEKSHVSSSYWLI